RVGGLDEVAEGLAREVDAGKELAAPRDPRTDAAREDGNVGVARLGEDAPRARREPVVIVAKHDPGRAARNEAREVELQPAQRDRARPQQMALREDELLAHVDEGELAAIGEHGFEVMDAYRSHRAHIVRASPHEQRIFDMLHAPRVHLSPQGEVDARSASGEGVRVYREAVIPSPHPSPLWGEGADRV